MQDSPAAEPSVPKSRKKKAVPAAVLASSVENVPVKPH